MYHPINFGLDYNHNRDLMKFVPGIVMSFMPLSADEIDSNFKILNWSVLSMMNLPDTIYVKYAHLINWNTFLQTMYKKNAESLYKCRKYVLKNSDIFDNPVYKKLYTDDNFAKKFPELIDWDYAIIEKKLSIEVFEMFSEYVNCNLLCSHYETSIKYLKQNANKIDWDIVTRWSNLSDIIDHFHTYVDIGYLLQHRQLTTVMIKKLMYRIIPSYNYGKLLTRWQKLDCDFISQNLHWLNMKNICQWQQLTKHFIKINQHKLRLDYILDNYYLNKPGYDKFICINGAYLNFIAMRHMQKLVV